MKTTEKYAAKVKQPIAPATTTTNQEDATNEHSSNPYPRDLVLMRIRHILKNAHDATAS